MPPNVDGYHRLIDYLRISITDWCNLRCRYCQPGGKWKKLPHEEVLSYEEILKVSKAAVNIGIRKIRITGGEPLIRRNIIYLCRNLAGIKNLKSLTITTNGVLLGHFAEELWDSGIRRLNVSLDTLDPKKYEQITGKNFFFKVWEGIEKALEVGFHPVKINVVTMRGINDDEIESLAGLTLKYPLHVRFIELMPFADIREIHKKEFISTDEVIERLGRIGDIEPTSSINVNGPAVHFKFRGAPGKVGLISPISHHFCPTCNRLRLTADGKLRACLFSDQETDIKRALRSGASEKELQVIFHEAILNKPKMHHLKGTNKDRSERHRPMVAIGG